MLTLKNLFRRLFKGNRKFIIILLFFLVDQLYLFSFFPYKTTDLHFISPETIQRTNTPSPNFQIANIKWNVDYYSKTPDLEEFRKFFKQHCASLTGLAAANCVADELDVIPIGNPATDSFSRNYDPRDDLRRHLKGEAGHCVTYSSITADSLLSVGIPALLVQILQNGGGHNINVLWDDKLGWIYFDPIDKVVLKKDGKMISALDALKNGAPVKWEIYNPKNDNMIMRDFYNSLNLSEGTIIYPEPWYYTRTGERQSAFIYRGAAVGTGEDSFKYGTIQRILRTSIALHFALSLALMTLAVFRKFKGYL